jgi:zinc and cadmium transporter
MQIMSEVTILLILVFLGSVGALAGGILLLFNKSLKDTLIHILVPFAAGALLGATFFELLPEAMHHAEEAHESGQEINIFIWVLLGIMFFYLLERGIHWLQYHRKERTGAHKGTIVPLIIIGDSVHNFVDGMAIAVTFLVDPAIGVLTTIAVAAHEIPQEIGDFAVLLHEGLSAKKVFLYNLLSALLAVLGAVIVILVGESLEWIFPYALALTGGFFIYIALSNLLPAIHSEEKKGYAFYETLFLLLGVFVIWGAITLLGEAHVH